MKENILYFKYSLNNKDNELDLSNPIGKLVIAKNKNDKKTQLQKSNNELIELIITYKNIKNKNLQLTNEIINKIIDLLEKQKLISYTAFCSYFQVLKFSYNSYIEKRNKLNHNEKLELFKNILDNYIENRHNIYMCYGYSDQILQVMSDISSSRRNSKTGIEKLESILYQKSIEKTNNIKDLDIKNCYILPDKDGKNIFNECLNNKNIKFSFQKNRQNKYPDMLLIINKHIYIIEHKMINGDGGSQNLEINEIISFIQQSELNKNIHYISCLQGDFMQKLNINTNDNKLINKHTNQYYDIINTLTKYQENFFVNGAGFKKLIDDLSNQ